MSFNQVSGKIQENPSKHKPNRREVYKKPIAFYKEVQVQDEFASNINIKEKSIQKDLRKSLSKYTLPWVKIQKETDIQKLALNNKVTNLKLGIEKIDKNDEYLLLRNQLEEKTKSLNFLKKELFDPWHGKIKKKEEDIILNYLNGKIQVNKTHKNKKKQRSSFNKSQIIQESRQFVFIPLSDFDRYKKSIKTYKKNVKNNKIDVKPKQQRKSVQNKNLGSLLKQRSLRDKQNQIIKQLRNKVERIEKNQKIAQKSDYFRPHKQKYTVEPVYANDDTERQLSGYNKSFIRQIDRQKYSSERLQNNSKWKTMQKNKLLLKNRSSIQQIQIIKPKDERNFYDKKCNVSGSQLNFNIAQKQQIQQQLKNKRIKTETKCQTQQRFSETQQRLSASRMSKISQGQKQDSKRIIYYDKQLQEKQKKQEQTSHTNNYIKKLDSLPQTNYFNSCAHSNRKTQLGKVQIKFPMRIPDKSFLNLKTFYWQKVKKINNDSLFPTISENHARITVKRLPRQSQLLQFIQTYTAQYRKINIKKLMSSQDFKILLNEGQSLYFGQFRNNKKEGLGITIKPNYLFQGVYKNDSKLEGLQINQIGKYIGQFNNNKKEGKGQFLWKNGEYYNGQWQNGKKHGNGMWSSSNGDHYIGEWFEGKVQGQGIHTSLKGQHYEGQFKNYLKEGWGKEDLPNGDNYEGDFVEGKPHGKGTYKWKNGAIYQGQFVKGSRNGIGILTDYSGNSYKGHFNKQEAFGFCQINFSNFDFYEGIIQNAQFNGRGTLKLFSQKQIWNGHWVDDQFVESIK